jgi:peptidoglycan/xylan/chitin deacetylase (PgdA/CDA1 family)
MWRRFLCILCFSFWLPSTWIHAKEIALTFDDAPRASSQCLDTATRSQLLIQQLQQAAGVPAMFMVTTNNIAKQGNQALKAYVQAGHLLGNHSHSHQHPETLGLDSYLADVRQAHEQLLAWAAYRPYYRFPFLNEGRTIAMRDGLRKGLSEIGLTQAYVTVDNYDWYIDQQLQNALQQQQAVDIQALGDWYVEEMMKSIRFYDDIAVKHIGRSPKHVLLLHENDVAALFLGDLIKALTAEGWRIISPIEAYQDPIASGLPGTLFNNQGRVAALARLQGIKKRDLVPLNEEESYLDEEFKRRVLKPGSDANNETLITRCRALQSR